MDLSTLDWAIIGGYIVFALAVGIFYARRASKSSEEYYLAGRTLPWWVVGTSMVATTFAADTPLAITEMVRGKGIWENWFWWNWLLYGLLGVFLFSRLWRRARVLTDNELIELRYSGKPAAFLRGYKAVHFGVIFNLIIMGWVIESMSSVLAVMLNLEKSQMLWTLVGIAVIYSLLSGFWGVVVTDLVQFAIAMVGSIVLAALALHHVGGIDGLKEKLEDARQQRVALTAEMARLDPGEAADEARIASIEEQLKATPNVNEQTMRFVPRPAKEDLESPKKFLLSPFFNFLVLILFMWWNNHSTDGGGYIIQRMMAARNEKHALLGTLWYNLANYALRVWPWVIVALVSLVLYPDLAGYKDVAGNELGEKAGYPLVMKQVLGPGLVGLLVVSFLAAFMSTIDTHLNWGSSYLVNDLFRRFIARNLGDRAYVMVGRAFTVVLMLAAGVLSTQMESVSKAWNFLWAMGAGIGSVLILRWFWWRINAWTEIAALTMSFLVTVCFEIIARQQTLAAGQDYVLFDQEPVLFGMNFPFHLQLLVIVALSIATWLIVTFSTRPEDREKLVAFYKRTQPGGWWGPIKGEVKTTMEPVSRGIVTNFIAGLALVWGATFSIGYFVFKNWGPGFLAAFFSAAGFWWIWKNCISRIDEPLDEQ